MKLILATIILFNCIIFSVSSQNVVVVVIDGARYSETFGNPNFNYIPNMSKLATNGTYLDAMYNQNKTYTSQAVPALWTGGWNGTYNLEYGGVQNQATYSPSIFEYFRKQKNVDASQCVYILSYVKSLWLQSFHPDYGPDYWPQTISSGSSDNDVLDNTLDIINKNHPQFLWVYLADVDHAGHSGDWNNYISAIQNADEIVNTLWTTIQKDDFYKDKTTMLVTNDHGRHDDKHGGFSGHGCSCDGCRHIMLLAMGPDIKQNFISRYPHETADIAVTASYLLNLNPEYSTGKLISEIFNNNNVGIKKTYSQVKLNISDKNISFELNEPEYITLAIYDLLGREIEILAKNKLVTGFNNFEFSKINQSGFYLIKLKYRNRIIANKIIISR